MLSGRDVGSNPTLPLKGGGGIMGIILSVYLEGIRLDEELVLKTSGLRACEFESHFFRFKIGDVGERLKPPSC